MTTLCAESIKAMIAFNEPPLIVPPDRWCSLEAELDWTKRIDRIEGSAFELSIGNVFVPGDTWENQAKLGINERNIPPAEPIEWNNENETVLYPDTYYLIQSAETVNIPNYLYARVEPRTSWFRMGCSMDCASAHPGYSGVITVGLYVHREERGVLIERGARFCNLHFLEFDSRNAADIDPYKGVWSGDKTDTGGQSERGF